LEVGDPMVDLFDGGETDESGALTRRAVLEGMANQTRSNDDDELPGLVGTGCESCGG